MRISRLFVRENLTVGDTLSLDADRAHYLRSVLRMRVGQVCHLFNGRGGAFSATVVAISKREVLLDLTAFMDDDRESPLQTHLGIGLVRSSAMDESLGHATELGATHITPLQCEYSQLGQRQNTDKRMDRWQQVIISAAEQCGRNQLPELHPITPLETWSTEAEYRLVAHPGVAGPISRSDTPTSIALAVGPEGGFSAGELEQLTARGFHSIGLGPRILRTPTAALAMLTVSQSLWGDVDTSRTSRDQSSI
ncbi:MAG: 16S rRNA (uracil(1498)-N(3))-methyltransferase, partial [Pseudomonadota bacterium]